MRPIRVLIPVLLAIAVAWPASAGTADRTAYQRALSREQTLARKKAPPLAEVRSVINAYRDIVARYPRSPYSDNALWQAAGLSLALHRRTGSASDQRAAASLLKLLVSEYPSSSLRGKARSRLKAIDTAGQPAPKKPAVVPARKSQPDPGIVPVPAPGTIVAKDMPVEAIEGATDRVARTSAGAAAEPAALAGSAGQLLDIRRSVLADVVRVTLELDTEPVFEQQQIEGPPRLFFDLKNVSTVPRLEDATLTFDDEAVRSVRLGRHPDATTRVVMDLDNARRYSVFTLYNPYRLVVDFEREPSASLTPLPSRSLPAGGAGMPTASTTPTTGRSRAVPAAVVPTAASEALDAAEPAEGLIESGDDPALTAAPAVPSANMAGGFSLARQLGLGVSRIVIDPGHGGKDPGARYRGVSEASLVLDIALRLEKLLLGQPGFEVVLTRRTNVFIPLEQRTAIANREAADLFLSIHVNASRNKAARGIETYFLNFASNPEAEAVAARENSASAHAMRQLPDLLKAIALNNKLDESRDLARMVQSAMIKELRGQDPAVRDLGVKQAPFVVLIGAGMPSVLAEVSFLTHPKEGQLLRSSAYRQKIAQALCDAVLRYRRSLKTVSTVALQ